MATTLISGGTVVTATEIMDADVLIDGTKVVGLFARGGTLPELVVDRVGILRQ